MGSFAMSETGALRARKAVDGVAGEGLTEGLRNTNPRVLVLLSHYLPGFQAGGPVRSISNLISALGGEYDFRIVTSDRDLGDNLPFPGVVSNQWIRVGLADVRYLRAGLPGFLRMCALLCSVDRNTVIYLNSFFARRYSMLAVLMRWLKVCRPRCLVIAPRGEFSPGAMRFKRSRKVLYIRLCRSFGLYSGLIWHASSDFEAEDITRQFPLMKNIKVAGIVPTPLDADWKRRTSEAITASDIAGVLSPLLRGRPRKMPGQLRAVFVSRVSRKKNLAGALRMLRGVSGDVTFDIYGPAEDAEYWEECQGLMATLPANTRVRYKGKIEHEGVAQVFAENDLFLFPTLGENYGHVICESLMSGCPVLISDQTPWRNLEAEGIGWDIPLDDAERFRSVLQQCVDGDDEWFAELSQRATHYASKRASDPGILNANRELFQRAFTWRTPR